MLKVFLASRGPEPSKGRLRVLVAAAVLACLVFPIADPNLRPGERDISATSSDEASRASFLKTAGAQTEAATPSPTEPATPSPKHGASSESVLGSLHEGVEGAFRSVTQWAVVLAAVGTLCMAVLEVLKVVFLLHRVHYRRIITKWTTTDPPNCELRRQLNLLLMGAQAECPAWYDQSSDAMFKQLQATASIALDYPKRFEALYGFLSSGLDDAHGSDSGDATLWYHEAGIEAAERVAQGEAGRQRWQLASEARLRLGHAVGCKIDALQVMADLRWARINQILSVLAGTSVLWIYLPSQPAAISWWQWLPIKGALALAGGTVAPLAKDIVAALMEARVRMKAQP